ncbi:MAG TPA: response regulator [Sedimentisphaerales bacterium]|jgi:CheY-like chemotaxis protein|nr:response regulator [Sedimentisphaerales bacterium]HNU30051.1 response regulator [Sedimentisphaerales bacterium]
MSCAQPILLIEDDPVDALAIRRALDAPSATDAVIHASSVREALAVLHSRGSPRPALILLDLNMPGTDGLTFLQIVKDDPDLRDIPIVALTVSDESEDIACSFDRGVAGYMVKSADYACLQETVRTIQHYWNLNRLPACPT